MSTTLILCPLKKELNYLLEGFSKFNLNFIASKSHRIVTYTNHDLRITLSLGGHGKTQFGIQTQYLIHQLPNLELIIGAGSAGGLAEHLSVGDLIIGESIIEHDFKEKFNPNKKKPTFLTSELHINQIKSTMISASDYDYKIHYGPIASGDEDITTRERAQLLLDQTQALAVAWEGSGGIRAAKFNEIPYLEIRAITDNARNSVGESFLKNLQPSMHNIAHFIFQCDFDDKY